MTVQARFPEIPKDLHEEPILSRFAEVFGDLLPVARNPSACASQHDAANHYYLKTSLLPKDTAEREVRGPDCS